MMFSFKYNGKPFTASDLFNFLNGISIADAEAKRPGIGNAPLADELQNLLLVGTQKDGDAPPLLKELAVGIPLVNAETFVTNLLDKINKKTDATEKLNLNNLLNNYLIGRLKTLNLNEYSGEKISIINNQLLLGSHAIEIIPIGIQAAKVSEPAEQKTFSQPHPVKLETEKIFELLNAYIKKFPSERAILEEAIKQFSQKAPITLSEIAPEASHSSLYNLEGMFNRLNYAVQHESAHTGKFRIIDKIFAQSLLAHLKTDPNLTIVISTPKEATSGLSIKFEGKAYEISAWDDDLKSLLELFRNKRMSLEQRLLLDSSNIPLKNEKANVDNFIKLFFDSFKNKLSGHLSTNQLAIIDNMQKFVFSSSQDEKTIVTAPDLSDSYVNENMVHAFLLSEILHPLAVALPFQHMAAILQKMNFTDAVKREMEIDNYKLALAKLDAICKQKPPEVQDKIKLFLEGLQRDKLFTINEPEYDSKREKLQARVQQLYETITIREDHKSTKSWSPTADSPLHKKDSSKSEDNIEVENFKSMIRDWYKNEFHKDIKEKLTSEATIAPTLVSK